MADQNVTVSYDTSGLSAGVQAAIQSLTGQKDAVIQLAQVMEQYNKNGDLVKQTLSGMNAEGERFEIRLKSVKGQLEITGATVKVLGDDLAKLKDATSGGLNIDFSKLGTSAATAGISLLADKLVEGVHNADQLSIQLARIQNIANQPGEGAANSLINQLTTFGNKFGVSQIEAANAALTALRTNVGRTGDAMEVLNRAAEFSKATGAGLNESVTALTRTMDAYGLSSDKAVNISNLLFTLFKNSNVDVNQLAEGMGRLSVRANAVGLDETHLAAIILDLTNKGLTFNQASTVVTSTLSRIQAPTKQFTDLLLQNGIASTDAAIKAGEFGKIINILSAEQEKGNEHFKDFVGGMRSATGIKILASDAEGLAASLEKVTNGLDNTAAAAARVTDTAGSRVARFKQTVDNAFTFVGAGVNNLIDGSVKGFKIWAEAAEAAAARVNAALGNSGEIIAFNPNAGAQQAEKEANDNAAKVVDAEIKSLEQRKNAIVAFSGEVAAQAVQVRDSVIATLDQVVDHTRLSARSYHDDISKIIRDFETQAQKAQAAVEAARKSLETVGDKSGARQFADAMKYASGGYIGQGGFIINDQQATVIQGRIDSLYKRARQLSTSNDANDIAEARKLYDEIDRLQQQSFDHRQANEQKIYEYKVKTGQVQPTGTDVNGNAVYQRMVNINELETTRNKLIKEREAMENAAKARFQEQANQAKAVADEEKKNLEEVQLLTQKAVTARTKYFDQTGNFKKEFDTTDKQKAALADINKIFDDLSKKIGTPQALGFTPQALIDLAKLRDELNALATSGTTVTGAKETSNKATADFEKQKADLLKIKDQFKDGIDIIDITKVKQQFGAVDESSRTSLDALKETFDPENNKISDTLEALKEMQTLINNIGNPAVTGPTFNGAPGEMYGGKPHHMAVGGTPTHKAHRRKSYGKNDYMWSGGPVSYMADGGYPVSWVPRGSDNVPAMLDPREFVMNAQATQAFAPILEAMNGMQIPKPTQKAGGAVTNVGDINVTVNGGSTAPQTIQSIANGLRRELRRGTISLNTASQG